MNDNRELNDAERIVIAMGGADIVPGARIRKRDGLTTMDTDSGWTISFLTDGPVIRTPHDSTG